MERGLNKPPLFNLALNNTATRLESETGDDCDNEKIIPFANRLTWSGQSYCPPSPTNNTIPLQPPGQRQMKTPDQRHNDQLLPLTNHNNDPSFIFRPSREK